MEVRYPCNHPPRGWWQCELLGEPCLLEHQAMRWVPVTPPPAENLNPRDRTPPPPLTD